MISIEEKKVKLLRELRSELVTRGLMVTSDLSSVDGKEIKFNIMVDSMMLICQWVTKSGIHRYHCSNKQEVERIADFLIRTLDESYKPTRPATPPPTRPTPPQAKPQQHKPAKTSISGPGFVMNPAKSQGARVVDKVTITREEYQEYMMLKKRANDGVFITKAAFEDIKYGYINPAQRDELNKRMDLLIRRMSI